MALRESLVAREGIHPAWHGDLTDLPVVVLDVETTGLDPTHDRIIEIAVLTGEQVIDTRIRPDAVGHVDCCHGLRAADLRGAPSFEDIAPVLHAALCRGVIVGHCVAFDLAFLRAEFERIGRRLAPIPYVCTAALADALALGHPRRRLSYACARYGIELTNAHVARHDARAAAELFQRYAAIAVARRADLATLAAAYEPDSPEASSWSLPPLAPVG